MTESLDDLAREADREIRREPLDVTAIDRHCPGCGLRGVVVGLDSVLMETIPTVRRHTCGLGGPGSAVSTTG